MICDWRKWGFGFSMEFRDPFYLRLWIGPIRIGWAYGRVADLEREANK